MVSKSDPGLGERSPAGRSRKKLDAKFRFKPEKPTTDDRFGDAQPERGGGNSPGVGDFDERPYVFDIQLSVPHPATQRAATRHYRIALENTNLGAGLRRCWRTSQKNQCRSQRQ